MTSPAVALIQIFALFLLAALALGLGVGLVWLVFRITVGTAKGLGAIFGGVFALIGHVLRHLVGTLVELLRFAGALIAAVFLPLAVMFNIGRGRWGTSQHYGKALVDELANAASALYRATLAHPLRLVGLGALLDGVENRMPEVVAAAPGADRPAGGPTKAFDGYVVTGSLPAGGSGAKLWVARPTPAKHAQLAAQFAAVPAEVVIKAFDLSAGSTLPQIVRENRALEAARKLGLVLEHHMAADRFHYVMPYVAGADLSEVARRMHGRAAAGGLDDDGLRAVSGYAASLLGILARFHAAGLWHKDIKPSNIIVGEGRVELVDLGLVTPLASAMTLTTHGTEYYRDPEMVRLAMRGVKVHEVDGVKFDLYSAGAVLYFLIEHSFPAHGSLSAITKRCPEAVRWIVRRAMASLESRYGSAGEMLRDVEAVLASKDPFALRPADLPSMGGRAAEVERAVSAGEPAPWKHEPPPPFAPARQPTPVGAAAPGKEVRRSKSRGWTGVLVAAGLMLGLFTVGAFSLLLYGGFGGSREIPAPAAPGVNAESSATARAKIFQRRAKEAAFGAKDAVRGLVERGQFKSAFEFDQAGSNPLAFEVATEVAPRFDGLEIALFPAGPVPAERDELDAFADRLASLPGIRVIGQSNDGADGDVELWARLRAAAGLSPLGDEGAAQRVLDVLRAAHGSDVLLWHQQSADGKQLEYRMFVRDPDQAEAIGLLRATWIAADAAAAPQAASATRASAGAVGLR